MAIVDRTGMHYMQGPLADDIDADRAGDITSVATVVGTEAVSAGAAPVALDPDVYQSNVTSDGVTGAAQSITLADAALLGQRKLIVVTLADVGDDVLLNANIVDTSITFETTLDEILLEFNGTVWAVVLNNGATVV